MESNDHHVLTPGEDRVKRPVQSGGKMHVILYMKIAHLSPGRADMHAWEGVLAYRLLLIEQRLVGVQTSRPQAHDGRASRQPTPQGHVNNAGYTTMTLPF